MKNNVSNSDHCAHCGYPLVKAPLGGTYRCCAGAGYWTKRIPMPGDGPLPLRANRAYVNGGGTWRLYMNIGYNYNATIMQPCLKK